MAVSPLDQLQLSYVDDPRVLADAEVDDYNDHIVPSSYRMARFPLMMAWWGVASAMFYVVTGAAVAASVGTASALAGIVLTVLVYGAINGFLSILASETGLSVAMLSRSMFGFVGAALATLILAATAIYYFVFEGAIIGVAFQYQFGGKLNLWFLAVCVGTVPLVLRGVSRWLDKINGVLLPFYLIGIVGAVVWAAVEHGNGWEWLHAQGTSTVPLPGWLIAFCSYMGVWILMMYTVDFSRLGRHEDKKFNAMVTFGPVFYVLLFLVSGIAGIYLASTVPLTSAGFGEAGAAIAFVELMGVLGVLLVLVTQIRINTVNLYLASANLDAFFNRVFRVDLPRGIWVVVAVAIGYIMMVSGVVLKYVLQAFLYQGIFVTAWVAIAVVHGVYVRRTGQRVESRPWRVPAINPGGMLAWFGSVAVGLGLVAIPGIDPVLVTLAPIITVVLAAGIYAISLRWAKRDWFRIERGLDPADEVDDPWEARIKCTSCEKSYIAIEMDRADASVGGAPYCSQCAERRQSSDA